MDPLALTRELVAIEELLAQAGLRLARTVPTFTLPIIEAVPA